MRKPSNEEKVRCPDSTTDKLYPPDRIYPGTDGSLRGILQEHHHRTFPGTRNPNPCPWGGLPVPIIRQEKKEQ